MDKDGLDPTFVNIQMLCISNEGQETKGGERQESPRHILPLCTGKKLASSSTAPSPRCVCVCVSVCVCVCVCVNYRAMLPARNTDTHICS